MQNNAYHLISLEGPLSVYNHLKFPTKEHVWKPCNNKDIQTYRYSTV